MNDLRWIFFGAFLMLATSAQSMCMGIPWTRVWAHEVDVLQCGTSQRLFTARYLALRFPSRHPGFDLREFIADEPHVALLVRPRRTFIAQFTEYNGPYPPPGCWAPNTLEQTEFLVRPSAARDCSGVAMGKQLFAVSYQCNDTPSFEYKLRQGLELRQVEDQQAFEQWPDCSADLDWWPPRKTAADAPARKKPPRPGVQ